jgi:predicted hydrolase (HD superfamily)
MTDHAEPALARLAEGVLLEAVNDEAVLMQLDRGQYYSLNAVGARMLALARACPDVAAVIRAMADEFEADEDTLRRDLLGLLADLESSGLIEPLAGGAAPAADLHDGG